MKKVSLARFLLILLVTVLPGVLSFAQDAESDITEHYKRMMVYHTYMDGSVPEGAVLFIGDSITQGLCVVAVHGLAVNYGIGSDTTLGVLERLPVYRSMERAAAVVIAIGVNDLRRRDNNAILENYKKIMAAVPADVPLLFSAVLPLDDRNKPEEGKRNERIRELNRGLEALCASEDRCIFLDSTPSLVDDTGNLDPAHHTGDGVHLNTAGYTLWIRDLRDKLDALPAVPRETP